MKEKKKTPTLNNKVRHNREFEAIVVTAQDQAVLTIYIKPTLDKSHPYPKCRLCSHNSETIDHILDRARDWREKKKKKKGYMTTWLGQFIGTCRENARLCEQITFLGLYNSSSYDI